MKVLAAMCAGAALILGASSTSAQSSGSDAQLPDVFSALDGVWSGTGTLMGRPASFEMEWKTSEGGFVELRFRNFFVDASGILTPVLEARALYRPSGTTAVGVWIDTRPQRLQLESEVSQSAVITNWIAQAERGRTEYRIEDGGVTVRDYVEVDGEMQLFGEAHYHREGNGT